MLRGPNPPNRSQCPALSAIESPLFPRGDHISVCGSQDFDSALELNDNTGQQNFGPGVKMSVSEVLLGAEFDYVSRISVSPTLFVPG